MDDIQNFNVYRVNSSKSITRYTISRTSEKYKIKMKMKESFNSTSECIERILDLQDKGYACIDLLLSTLSNKDINKLFMKNNFISERKKKLNLNLGKIFNINF